jgi:excisionase family DNA binding protein
MEQLITLKAASELLHLSPCSLYRKVERAELPAIRIGRVIRFKVSALEKFVDSRAVGPAPGEPKEGSVPGIGR